MVPHNDAIRLDCRTIHIIRQWSPSRCSELLPGLSRRASGSGFRRSLASAEPKGGVLKAWSTKRPPCGGPWFF
jgi:hypothetical protein